MKKQQEKMIINSTEIMVNSANKLGRHLDLVKSGCGPHKNKKGYTRKTKHKQAF